ncbi:hypothetical protein HPC49_06500 [Pyxidicoccus fallax]|uniref:3-oxoacyl-(Acyl carrier protein) synthase n=1 Tax=Pyxidicoccus fallax TaxID=394095 RepID=A0A848LI55_9BACT|nr:hypothetical protein [Pyxidicoccus fallax]NMO17397.1 hypothetical protein [Pyxidicoccus fallax]NPC77904.1 hypothetical protein [Pyxidicoccus fallax]
MGLRWASACAALRAGINRKQISPYFDNQGREIVISHMRDTLKPRSAPEERWLFFLTHALQEILEQTGTKVFEQLPLLIALPAAPAMEHYSAEFLVQELAPRLKVVLNPDKVRIFTEGSYGGYSALAAGRRLLRQHEAPACVVAGAESMMCARTLLRLSERHRLLVEGNSDGVIPGEAAACVLLSLQGKGLAAIRGMGFSREPASLENDLPLRADGITASARAALDEAKLALHDVAFRFSDAAGESFYFKEQALLVSRLLRERKSEFPLWLCAESLGDTGAAAGLCGMLWAIAAWTRRYAPGHRAIGFAGNEYGGRAAVILESVG